jgi:branched-subunit amino acid transport protein
MRKVKLFGGLVCLASIPVGAIAVATENHALSTICGLGFVLGFCAFVAGRFFDSSS